MIQVYGLNRCDSCRKARNWLERFGIDYRFVDYRDQRVSPGTLQQWAEGLGGFDVLINRQSTAWRKLPSARRHPGSAPEWLLLLKEHPQLIKRPIVVDADGEVSVGFSDALFKRRFPR